MDLKNWVILFLNNQDLAKKDILEIQEISNTKLLIKRNSQDQTVLLMPDLKFEELKENQNVLIITLNKKSNIDLTIKNWKELSQKKNLDLIFLNSTLENKWILNPYTHNIICDKQTLKQGLLTIAENVGFVE
ncbi:hypothetical protein COV11_03390 [Candidatus Woesearchaeota archaeon CG10_big_fil_rev_8_21_14_0_10_30_7]|nr:MAG: hypothetical protein COV11_03390 [Candidatus Woesearchaeota archaeon CG10_big_fil_rev_8_21_14_0_10_30_7]